MKTKKKKFKLGSATVTQTESEEGISQMVENRKNAKKPKIVQEDVEEHDKKIVKKTYWQQRAILKIEQSVRGGDGYLKEARDFIIHADLYTDKVMNAFEGIKKAYNKLAKAITEVKVK